MSTSHDSMRTYAVDVDGDETICTELSLMAAWRSNVPDLALRKRLKSKIDNRARKNDVPIQMPRNLDDARLPNLPEDELNALLDIASQRVGKARLAESNVIVAIRNLRQIVMWEHLLGEEIDPGAPRPFRPFRTVNAAELLEQKKDSVGKPAVQGDVA